MLNELAKAYLGSIVRWLLTLVSAYLVSKGIVGENVASQFNDAAALGVAGVLISLLWGLWNKYRANFKIDRALALPAGTSRTDLERKVDDNLTNS